MRSAGRPLARQRMAYREDPWSLDEVERYHAATSQIAQTTLRSVLGRADLDMLLSERERLNEALQQIIDEQTDPWGIKVSLVEIKDVGIPQGMQRAMARQAEAERERRAKVINAEGEFQASERLRDAADIMSGNPARCSFATCRAARTRRQRAKLDDCLSDPDRPARPLLSTAGQADPARDPEQPLPDALAPKEPPDGELALDHPPPKELASEEPQAEQLVPTAPPRDDLTRREPLSKESN